MCVCMYVERTTESRHHDRDQGGTTDGQKSAMVMTEENKEARRGGTEAERLGNREFKFGYPGVLKVLQYIEIVYGTCSAPLQCGILVNG